jgi:hypothetical protein
MTCRRAGRLVPTLLMAAALLPAGASTAPAELQAAKAANRARIWARQIFVSVRGEPIDHLAVQVGQQLMTRVRAHDAIAHRPVSAYAADCTVAQLCEGLAAGFGFRMVPYAAAESVHLQLEPGDKAARGSGSKAPGKGGGPASKVRGAAAAAGSGSAATKDPRLQERLDLSAPEVDDETGGLPVILEALAHAGGIPILADHATPAPARAPRAGGAPEGATRFLAGLDGRTLGEALDRTARAFSYRWSLAGGWFFFKPLP